MIYRVLATYWQPVHESRQHIAAWCKERNIATKGHPLVWNYSQLPWLPDDLAEVEKLQLAHVDNCVGKQ